MQRLHIDPQHWAALNRLLDAALDMAPAERDRWLQQLGPADRPLQPQLRELLSRAAQVETRDFLSTLPALAAPASIEQAGASIGPYRLIRELGSGGMGAVWLAERMDGLLKRPVALKLPHVASPHAQLAERMAREREILATLTHSNIARLYDAGVSGEGRPYLALEYVEGEPIDVHCRRLDLDIPTRLRLFLQVAEAVAYAHAKLIIHRDLKPANILVTSAGEVRLLDFGVAKLLEDGQARATQLTELSGRALTLDYAAPEQIAGHALTTAADVYSLGVVLYELLTDIRPYRLKRDTRGALEEAILHDEAPRPSDALEGRRRRLLRGDLDTIVLKALKKAAADRYATVSAFAEDVARFLDGRPVLAQPDRAAYRAYKFIARHRVGAAIAASVTSLIVASAVFSIQQAREARAEQQRAEEARAFIESIFVDADPYGQSGRPMTAVELLRQAHARMSDLQAGSAEVRVELLNALASSMINLDDASGAGTVLEEAQRAAAELPTGHIQTLRAQRLLARLRIRQGQPRDALQILDAPLAAMRRDERRYGAELVAALLDRTEAQNAALDWEAAEASAREAITVAGALDGDFAVARINGLMQLAESQDRRNQSAEAFETARSAYALAQATFKGAHPLVDRARAMYAAALWSIDAQDEAVDLMRQSWREAVKVFGPDSQVAGLHAQKMTAYLTTTGHYREALTASEDAMRILGPTYPENSVAFARLLDAQTGALLNMSRPAEALEAANRAHSIYAANLGASHEQTQIMQVYRARAMMLLGRLEEAAHLLDGVIEGYRRTGYATVAAPTYLRALVARLAGDPAAALRLQADVLEAVKESPTAERWRARVLIEMGLSRLLLGEVEAAQSALREGLQIVDRKFRAPTTLRAAAQIGLGRIDLLRGDPAAALPSLQQAEAFWRDLAPHDRLAGEAAFWLAQAYRDLGSIEQSAVHFERAERILIRSNVTADRELVRLARRALTSRA